jgi:hypothetical protein
MHKSLPLTTLVVAFAAAAGPPSAQSEFLTRGMPYAAFDAMPKTELPVPGGMLRIGVADGDLALPRQDIIDWIARSARAVSIYFGTFPVRDTRILIVPVDGRGVRGGQAFGYRGAAIRVRLGRAADKRALDLDWVMVHEMIHLALPNLDDRHNWLSEGMATYVESIARAQAGDRTDEAIWAEFVRDMPKGLPGPGDRGLDDTPSWGRTYWGGAIFCLLADIEIRKRSGNRYGLQDALRGIVAAGGTHETLWPIARVVAEADRAIGLTVVAELYEQHRATAVHVDLAALWRELGIRMTGATVTFDAGAPLASIRQSLTRPPRYRN